MQLVIFTGIQASGKSTFFKEHFFDTHIRINLDMLKTRHREWKLFVTCLQIGQKCVIDNTNPTSNVRSRYMIPAKEYGFEVVGYYFDTHIDEALERNHIRQDKPKIPEKGVQATFSQLETPCYEEGFDWLYKVCLHENHRFEVNLITNT